MPRVVIVDDDASADLLRDALEYRGYVAERVASLEAALDPGFKIEHADLVVLDMLLPSTGTTSISGCRHAGMRVYASLRGTKSSLPILVWSAIDDQEICDAIEADQKARFLHKWSTERLASVVEAVDAMLGRESTRPTPRPFIVHGRNNEAKLELKNYLQNTLGMPEPIILHEQANLGRTLMEKLEAYIDPRQFVFILLTPDDLGGLASDPNDTKRRARQNVVFEMGLFLGVIGRTAGRVILLHKGDIELPSDLSGIVYISINNGIEAAGEEIRREVERGR